MRILKHVNLESLSPEIIVAIITANWIFWEYCEELVITSCKDGQHSRNSLHYIGHAIDIRTNEMSNEMKNKIVEQLKDRLNLQYDVILEKTHIHIEFQPKR